MEQIPTITKKGGLLADQFESKDDIFFSSVFL
jgi:hypothetical protein